MIENLQLALTSLNTAKEIAKTLMDLRDHAKVNSIVIELQTAIIEAQGGVLSGQEAQLALHNRVIELEAECQRLKEWGDEADRYELAEVASGIRAYIEKGYQGDMESAVKLCAHYFGDRRKSILQQQFVSVGRLHSLVCPVENRTNVTIKSHRT